MEHSLDLPRIAPGFIKNTQLHSKFGIHTLKDSQQKSMHFTLSFNLWPVPSIIRLDRVQFDLDLDID